MLNSASLKTSSMLSLTKSLSIDGGRVIKFLPLCTAVLEFSIGCLSCSKPSHETAVFAAVMSRSLSVFLTQSYTSLVKLKDSDELNNALGAIVLACRSAFSILSKSDHEFAYFGLLNLTTALEHVVHSAARPANIVMLYSSSSAATQDGFGTLTLLRSDLDPITSKGAELHAAVLLRFFLPFRLVSFCFGSFSADLLTHLLSLILPSLPFPSFPPFLDAES